MYSQEKRKNPRNTALMLDMLHIFVGIFVVICAILAFLNPEKHQFLFPLIFLMAAVLNGVNGWFRLRDSGRDKKQKMGALAVCCVAGVLFLIGTVSAISIWR